MGWLVEAMNILYEYVLFCEVAIHHEHAVILLSSNSFSGSLRCWKPSLRNLMSLIRLKRGGMDGSMDGQMEGGLNGKNEKIHFIAHSAPLSL